MVGKWMVVLPLLVYFNKVALQPITTEARRLIVGDCCPCPGSAQPSLEPKFRGTLNEDFPPVDCPCRPRAGDAEASPSILRPALRVMEPFVKLPDQNAEPKPLLQPEVGLASSVLETLRQATDEEYHEALARDAARSAFKIIESTLDHPDDALIETPKKKIKIFLNTIEDDMDDNLLEASHVQETRCIHSPLKGIYKNGHMRISRPTPIIEVSQLSHKPTRKVKNTNILHRNHLDMDNRIGASNIQERVMHPNLDINLESLSSHNNLEKLGDQKGLVNNINAGSSLNQKIRPNIHLKLRELIDNLEVISKKEKSKIPVVDLTQYNSVTTQIPPLNLNPDLKLVHNKRPLLLKNILKLKDVELIPRNSLAKNILVEQSSFTNLKLQPENTQMIHLHQNIDNCKEQNSNLTPGISNTIEEMSINSTPRQFTDTETSSTNLNIANELKKIEKQELLENDFNKNIMKDIPIECMESFKNTDKTYTSVDLQGQDNNTNRQINLEKDANKVQLSDNCIEPTTNLQRFVDKKHDNQGISNNDLQTEEVKDLGNEENHDELNSEGFQIELIDDLDAPFEFDNSSFSSNSYSKSNDNLYDSSPNSQEALQLNDQVAYTSNNDLQTAIHYNLNPDMSEVSDKIKFDDCNSRETFSKNSNLDSDPQISMEINQEMNSAQKVFSEGNLNLSIDGAPDNFSHENQTQVSFMDLQHMSNSILRLSECEPLREKIVNIADSIEDLHQIYDDDYTPNTATSVPVFETNLKTTVTEDVPDSKTGFKRNDKINELAVNSDEKLCRSSISDETPTDIIQVDINKLMNSNANNIEMQAEPSEPESNLYSSMIPLLSNTVKNTTNSNILTKAAKYINDTIKIDNHLNFLNNLKSKLEVLFSTTEKNILSPDLVQIRDNSKESSKINPVITKNDKFKNINSLQRSPMTSFSGISPPKPLGMSLNSDKNKLSVPKYVTQPLRSESNDLLKFPLKTSKLFEEPKFTFNALSDKFRSHTENTIHNVKETLESTLKDPPHFRLSRPIEPIDTDDILESISNRHDEMKEKLGAIHVDLNDRLSSFQQSLLDNFNVLPDKISEFRENTNNKALGASYTPKRKDLSLLEASSLRNIKHDHDILPHRVTLSKNWKSAEINSLPIKKSVALGRPHFQNSNRGSFLQNPVLYSTTEIPSFIPRPKVLKTNIDSTPKLSSARASSKIPVSSDENVKRNKPLLFKPGRPSNELYSPPSSSSKISMPIKSLKMNAKNIKKDDSSVHFPVNTFKKTALHRNLNQKSGNKFNKDYEDLGTSSVLENNDHSSAKHQSLFSHTKERSRKLGFANNEEPIISPTSQINRIQSSEIEAGFQLVEPMKENVPYKCKLICYRDS